MKLGTSEYQAYKRKQIFEKALRQKLKAKLDSQKVSIKKQSEVKQDYFLSKSQIKKSEIILNSAVRSQATQQSHSFASNQNIMNKGLWQPKQKKLIRYENMTQSKNQDTNSKMQQQQYQPIKKQRKKMPSSRDLAIKKNRHILQNLDYETKKLLNQFSLMPVEKRRDPKYEEYALQIQQKQSQRKQKILKLQTTLSEGIKKSFEELSLELGLSKSLIQRLCKEYRQNEGIITIKKNSRQNANTILGQIKLLRVRQIIAENPSISFNEIVKIMMEKYDIQIGKEYLIALTSYLGIRKLYKNNLKYKKSKKNLKNPILNSKTNIQARKLYAQKFTKQIIQKGLQQKVLFIQEIIINKNYLISVAQSFTKNRKNGSQNKSINFIRFPDENNFNSRFQNSGDNSQKYSVFGVMSKNNLQAINCLLGCQDQKYISKFILQQFGPDYNQNYNYQGYILITPSSQKFINQKVLQAIRNCKMTHMSLPEYSGNMNITRQMLLHMKNKIIRKIIKNIQQGDSQYKFQNIMQDIFFEMDQMDMQSFFASMKGFIKKALQRQQFE